MSTRSSIRRLLSPIEDPKKLISRRNRSEPSLLFNLEEDDMAGQAPPPGLIPDLRSMEELLQAPTDGVGDAIIVPPILANQFKLKTGLLNLVTAISFHGFKNDDPHSHIRRFTKITQTVKLNQVPSDVIKLMFFPFSLEGAARTWLEKEPPNSITTWNDLVSKFVNHFFPPSKTTNLQNEITRFQQRFARGNFLTKNTQEAMTIIENKSKVQTLRNKPQVASASGSSAQDAHISSLTKQVEALLALHRPVDSVQNGINYVQNGCETCGSPHPYFECQATGGYTQDVYTTLGTYNQGEMMNQHMKMTEARMQEMQEYNNLQLQQLKNHNTNMENKMDQMQKVLMERPQGVLPSNTVPNPREDLKAITTRSGATLAGPSVPPPLSSSKEPSPASTDLPYAPVSSLMIPEPNPHQPSIPYPSRLNKKKLQGKADIQIHSFLQMFKKIHFNISFAEALAHMPKLAKMVKDLLTNKEKLLEMSNTPLNENCSAVLLKKLPEKLGDTRRFLIPYDFYGLESCMALADLAGIAEDVFIQVGKFTFPADFVVVDYEVDPRVLLILGGPFSRMAHA
ncbi:reverse transcriptase domain-containing protein [Tanacetum coccineum]